jgi:hypothetical protein
MDAPECPNYKRHACERNDPVILNWEADEYWLFGCRTCKCRYARSTALGANRARWKKAMLARRELQMTPRDRKVFYAPRQGWAA